MNESQIDYQDLLTQLRTFANFGYKVKKYWDIATPAQKSHMLSSMVQCTPLYSKGRLLNPKISPLYQAFRDFSEEKSTSGVQNLNHPELFANISIKSLHTIKDALEKLQEIMTDHMVGKNVEALTYKL